MRKTWPLIVALSLVLSLLGPLTALPVHARPDFPVEGGHFYTQASPQGAAGFGFRMTDDGGIPVWSTYKSPGGPAVLRYPISRRYLWRGFVHQATEKAILQWQPDAGFGQVAFVNVFGELSLAGKNDRLLAVRSNPRPLPPSGAEAGQSFDAIAASRLSLLDSRPAIKTRYLSVAGVETPSFSSACPLCRSRTWAAILPSVFSGRSYRNGRRTLLGPGPGRPQWPMGRPSLWKLGSFHVVGRGTRARVQLPDGRSFDGQVLGPDATVDVAVVGIPASGLPTVRFGNSDLVELGDPVVAIGYTPIVAGTPSARIGIGRNLVGNPPLGGAGLYDAISSDTFIHPGDSGGPLLNLRGEVVGINTSIFFNGTPRQMLSASSLAINLTKVVINSLR